MHHVPAYIAKCQASQCYKVESVSKTGSTHKRQANENVIPSTQLKCGHTKYFYTCEQHV